jgi:hypothetical protein
MSLLRTVLVYTAAMHWTKLVVVECGCSMLLTTKYISPIMYSIPAAFSTQ